MNTSQLYHEKILAYARASRTKEMPENAQYVGSKKNPTCGDQVKVALTLDDAGYILDIGAQVDGCALCEAGAGLLMEIAPGKHHHEFPEIASQIATWLARGHDTLTAPNQETFTPVRDFTSRHDCVCLPFQAVVKAFDKD